jgi:hypothetical protein
LAFDNGTDDEANRAIAPAASILDTTFFIFFSSLWRRRLVSSFTQL